MRQVVSEQTAATVADMMNQVVEGVPGHLAAIKGYHVAGKTGTTTDATLADGAVHERQRRLVRRLRAGRTTRR